MLLVKQDQKATKEIQVMSDQREIKVILELLVQPVLLDQREIKVILDQTERMLMFSLKSKDLLELFQNGSLHLSDQKEIREIKVTRETKEILVMSDLKVHKESNEFQVKLGHRD